MLYIKPTAVLIAVFATGITMCIPTEAKKEEVKIKKAEAAVQSVQSVKQFDIKWTKDTYKLNDTIIKMGVEKGLAKHMIDECKATAKDPRKCVKTAVAIYGNESSFGKNCYQNSCFGFNGFSFKSKEAAFDRWLKSYVKHWQNHTGAEYFYGGKGWVGKSHYCTSEVSSNSSVGCPFGARHFEAFYNKIS